jgi:hypothetical protein
LDNYRSLLEQICQVNLVELHIVTEPIIQEKAFTHGGVLDRSFENGEHKINSAFTENILRLKAFETGFCKQFSKFSDIFQKNSTKQAQNTIALNINSKSALIGTNIQQ